jgi:alpha-glucosidase
MKTYTIRFVVIILFVLSIISLCKSQVVFDLFSPDKKILTHIKVSNNIEFEVLYDSAVIVEYSEISLEIGGDKILGKDPWVKKKVFQSISEVVTPVVTEKVKNISNQYNEMMLLCSGKYKIRFRVYNNGVAWRFETDFKDGIRINNENIRLNFPEQSKVWFPEEESFFSHNERYYKYETLAEISGSRFCSLPTLLKCQNGVKILITESGLSDYPGMWLSGAGENALQAIFPQVPLREEQSSDRDVKVTEYANYIAETIGTRTFPWRILAIAKEDGDLITNQLSYLLAEPCAIKDPSWIKPGKVAWDWWNAWNIYGVDFRAGVNTQTYKYYIDFAAEFGIEYIIMDEGWYVLGNLLDVVPDINMEEIIAYADEKNVGVILWVIWKTLEDQWEEAFDQFERWGVKGLKVDFMQRDDQWMVNYYHRVAEEAAKRKMLVDFHGSYKPSGLRRKYPNVLTREGVKGLEQSKWSEGNTPDHNVTLPFIRMVAGPMDYTPGAMINANEENFRAVYTKPMSMGTRCHQLAMYVIYESPLQMLCDNPSNYYREPECMEFLSIVPTVWDSTVVLSAEVGKHITLARKYGKEWFVGAMTNWESREIELSFSFLDDGEYLIDILQDGINADRHASDFKRIQSTITPNDKVKMKLAPGGGWVARIYKNSEN